MEAFLSVKNVFSRFANWKCCAHKFHNGNDWFLWLGLRSFHEKRSIRRKFEAKIIHVTSFQSWRENKSIWKSLITVLLNPEIVECWRFNIHDFHKYFFWKSIHAMFPTKKIKKKIRRFIKFTSFFLSKHFHFIPMSSFYNERGINNDVSWRKSEVFLLWQILMSFVNVGNM